MNICSFYVIFLENRYEINDQFFLNGAKTKLSLIIDALTQKIHRIFPIPDND